MQSAFVNPPVACYDIGPTEVLDYAIDWTTWLPEGDTITGTPVVTQAGGDGLLTINPEGKSTTVSGNVTSWWCGTATVGEVYNVHVAITTTQGRTGSRYIQLTGVPR